MRAMMPYKDTQASTSVAAWDTTRLFHTDAGAGGDNRGTDVEEQRRDGGVAVDMDHAQVVRQVTLSGAHEEEPFDEQTQAGW